MLVMRAPPVIRRDPSKQDGIGYIMQAVTHNIGFHNSMSYQARTNLPGRAYLPATINASSRLERLSSQGLCKYKVKAKRIPRLPGTVVEQTACQPEWQFHDSEGHAGRQSGSRLKAWELKNRFISGFRESFRNSVCSSFKNMLLSVERRTGSNLKL